MTLNNQTKVKLSLSDYVKMTGFLVTWALIGYAFVADTKAQQRADQALNDARYTAVKEWQNDAGAARLHIYEALSKIEKSLSRIEGRLEKK